jgi:hypothetical protein
MLTRDLINNLCAKLDHEDKAPLIVKKLVQENWLEKVEDLQYVPSSRFERWEVPLKLIDEIDDYVIESEANAFTNGVSAWVNYSLRPAFDHYMSGPIVSQIEWLRDDAEKRNTPDLWAAKQMQRWYRRRKRRREQEKDAQLMSLALMESNSNDEFSRLSDKENEKRRRQRAIARIRVAVRAWVERKREKTGDPKGRSKGKDEDSKRGSLKGDNRSAAEGGTGLAALLLHHSAGTAKECEVSRLLQKVFQAARHGAKDESEIYLHRLVTQNWIEQIDDLELVEDKHYADWNFPEKIVVVLKQELREHREENGLHLGERAASVGNCAVATVVDIYAWTHNLLFGEGNDDESDGRSPSPKAGRAAAKSDRTRRL